MANKIEYSRMVWKRSSILGVEPTIPTGDTIDNTWLDTDILVGEGFINVNDDKFWFRTNNGITEINLSGVSSNNYYTDFAYLSGNTLVFDRNDLVGAYSVDLSAMTGGTANALPLSGGTMTGGISGTSIYLTDTTGLAAGSYLGIDANGQVVAATTPIASVTGNTTMENLTATTITITDVTGGTPVQNLGIDADGLIVYGSSSANDIYTTAATLSDNTIFYDTTDSLSAYSVSLSGVTGDYLDLTGGTMTGDIILSGANTVLKGIYDNNYNLKFYESFGNHPRICLSTDDTTFTGSSVFISDASAQLAAYGASGYVGLYTSSQSLEMYNNGQTNLYADESFYLNTSGYIRFDAPLTGGTPTGNLVVDASGNIISETMASLDYLPLTGGTMTGDIVMDGNKLSGAGTTNVIDLDWFGGGGIGIDNDNGNGGKEYINLGTTGLMQLYAKGGSASLDLGGGGNNAALYSAGRLTLNSDDSIRLSSPFTGTSAVASLAIDSNGDIITGNTIDSLTLEYLMLSGGTLTGPLSGTALFLTDTTGGAAVEYLGRDSSGKLVAATTPTITGDTTVNNLSATTLSILNSGATQREYFDYSSNLIKTGVTNSAIAGGSGNTISENLSNVFIAGVDITGSTSDTAYFTNLNVSGTLAGIPTSESFAISDETTAITTGTDKLTFYAPYAMTITDVKASISTSGSTGSEFDVNLNDTTIFSRRVVIDSGDYKSSDAALPPILSTTAVSEDDKLTFDIDIAGTGAAGAKIYIIGTRT